MVKHMEVVSTAGPLEAIVTKPGSHRAVDDHCQGVHLDITHDDGDDDDDGGDDDGDDEDGDDDDGDVDDGDDGDDELLSLIIIYGLTG